MAKETTCNSAERQAWVAVISALNDARETRESLKSEFESEAAKAYFAAGEAFERDIAQPLIKAAGALCGESE